MTNYIYWADGCANLSSRMEEASFFESSRLQVNCEITQSGSLSMDEDIISMLFICSIISMTHCSHIQQFEKRKRTKKLIATSQDTLLEWIYARILLFFRLCPPPFHPPCHHDIISLAMYNVIMWEATKKYPQPQALPHITLPYIPFEYL